MKIKVEKEALLTGLQKVQAVVAPRTSLPVLQNILFKAEDGKLWLTTTDLDLSVRACVEAEVVKAGETTLPAKRIMMVVREAAGNEVEIESDDRQIATIRAGATTTKLNGISADDFPPVPVFEGARSYAIDQGVFKAMLQRTGYAASTDESRQVLNGALLSFKEGRLTIVATDGRRLALIEQEVEFPKEAEAELVLPSKTIAEMIRTIDGEGAMKIHATANQVAFDSGKVVVVSKLVDGAYPNYRQVIPPQCEQRITIEREQFMSAVRRVALLTSDQSNSVKLTFAKNRVEVSAVTPEVGEAKETITVKYGGPDISVSFNPAFLLDPLKNLVADQIYFELNDEISPGVVKTDDPFLYVIMPMRMT